MYDTDYQRSIALWGILVAEACVLKLDANYVKLKQVVRMPVQFRHRNSHQFHVRIVNAKRDERISLSLSLSRSLSLSLPSLPPPPLSLFLSLSYVALLSCHL